MEYDPQELEELVNSALKKIPQSSRALFDMNATKVFDVLHAELKDYGLNHVDQVNIIQAVREKAYSAMITQDIPKSLQTLHGVLSSCNACKSIQPQPQVPLWNCNDPDLVIVTPTPLHGAQAETYLYDTLKSSDFTSDRVCATSVVRCAGVAKPNSETISNCSTRYLFTELQLLQPQLIVTLGKMPTEILFGESNGYTEMLGKPFWLGTQQVLPTHSHFSLGRNEKLAMEFSHHFQKAYQIIYGT